MGRYRFAHRYEAELRLLLDGSVSTIAGAEGDEVDLDDDVAAFIERDSPGALVEIKAKGKAKAQADVDDETDARAPDGPRSDRMERGRRRRDRQGDPGDAGAMTTADVASVVKE